MEYMRYLYNNIDLLMYLRYHPRWYKILYYEPRYFDAFLNEAREALKIRGVDRLEGIKDKIKLISMLSGLVKD